MERTSTNRAMNGEKPSKYFLNLHKIRNKNRNITHLIANDGREITSNKEILQEEKQFFENIYSQQPPTSSINSLEDLGLTCNMIPQLSEDSKNKMDAPYSVQELREALGHLNKNKCPSSDGLTTEFYSSFWDRLTPFYSKSLQHSFDSGRMFVE